MRAFAKSASVWKYFAVAPRCSIANTSSMLSNGVRSGGNGPSDHGPSCSVDATVSTTTNPLNRDCVSIAVGALVLREGVRSLSTVSGIVSRRIPKR